MSFAAASAAAEAAAAAASAEVAQQAPARPATRTMLHAPWSFWHVNRDSGRGPRGSAKQSAAYGSSLSLVGDIETAEEFWGVYCYLSVRAATTARLRLRAPLFVRAHQRAGGRALG